MNRLAMLILLVSAPAWADWQTLQFDLTRDDPNATTSGIPADAFTAGGLRLAVRPGVRFSLMSKRAFADEFDLELQIEVAERSGRGATWVDLVLLNEKQQPKVVATHKNSSLKPGTDSGEIRYFKDGKATGCQWEEHRSAARTSFG